MLKAKILKSNHKFFLRKFTFSKFWLLKVTFFCLQTQIWKWKSVWKSRWEVTFAKVTTESSWILFIVFTSWKSGKSNFNHKSQNCEFEPCFLPWQPEVSSKVFDCYFISVLSNTLSNHNKTPHLTHRWHRVLTRKLVQGAGNFKNIYYVS